MAAQPSSFATDADRHIGRDYGLWENAYMPCGHTCYTGSFPSHSDSIPGNWKSRSSGDSVPYGNGSGGRRPILRALEKPF